jgi:Domain of unknown function (DUF3846)
MVHFSQRHKTRKKTGWVLFPETEIDHSRVEECPPADGKRYTLEEIQKMVGGFFQIVSLEEKYIILADEDGLSKKLPRNEFASYLYSRHLVGNVAVINRKLFV